MADKKDVQTRQYKNTRTKGRKRIEKRVSAAPRRTSTASRTARKKSTTKKEATYSKRKEANALFSLIGCMFILIVMTAGVIGIFDKKSLISALFDNTVTENVLAGSDKNLYLVGDSDVMSMSAEDMIDIHLAEKINAKQNNYDWDKLEINGSYRVYRDDGINSKTGIDVSYYQKDIDWEKVKNDNIDFAIIRMGFRGYKTGALMIDETFDKNMREAIDAGIDVGVYFFTQAVTVKEAKEEAQFVLDKIKKYNITYPIVIDTEAINDKSARSHTADLTKEELTNICIAFCDEIDGAGYTSAIYASSSWFISQLNLEKLEKYDKWLAHYTKETTYPFEFSMWQYTDSGRVEGINGKVDMNISFKDYTKK